MAAAALQSPVLTSAPFLVELHQGFRFVRSDETLRSGSALWGHRKAFLLAMWYSSRSDCKMFKDP